MNSGAKACYAVVLLGGLYVIRFSSYVLTDH